MQAGNSNFSSIRLFQIGLQDYFGRGTGISTVSTENTGLWPPDTHQTGMKAFLIEIFAVRWRTKTHYLLASTEKASFGLSEKDQMWKEQEPRLQHSSLASPCCQQQHGQEVLSGSVLKAPGRALYL